MSVARTPLRPQVPGTSRVYACGDLLVDGFRLAYSDDAAATAFHR